MPYYFRDHELPEFLDFLDDLNCSGCQYSVVTFDGVVTACGGFGVFDGSDTADLCWGMVDAAQHKNRIGEFLLLGRLYRILQETDADYVHLGTCQLTEGFFQRYGFCVQLRITDGVADGLDDVQMHMKLTDEIRNLIRRQWLRRSGTP